MDSADSELADPKDKLILIVDDDESIQKLLTHIIVKEGFRAESAFDGDEGLKKIARLQPSLVILDLMLPRYGGFEVLRHLQAGEHSRIPIIVVTGRYTDRSTADIIRQESNVADFQEKPVKIQVLVGSLHRILRTRPPELSGGTAAP